MDDPILDLCEARSTQIAAYLLLPVLLLGLKKTTKNKQTKQKTTTKKKNEVREIGK